MDRSIPRNQSYYNIVDQKLHLDIDPYQGVIYGVSSLTILPNQPIKTINIAAHHTLDILDINVSGYTADFYRTDGHLQQKYPNPTNLSYSTPTTSHTTTSPNVDSLSSLDLYHDSLTPSAVYNLARSPPLYTHAHVYTHHGLEHSRLLDHVHTQMIEEYDISLEGHVVVHLPSQVQDMLSSVKQHAEYQEELKRSRAKSKTRLNFSLLSKRRTTQSVQKLQNDDKLSQSALNTGNTASIGLTASNLSSFSNEASDSTNNINTLNNSCPNDGSDEKSASTPTASTDTSNIADVTSKPTMSDELNSTGNPSTLNTSSPECQEPSNISGNSKKMADSNDKLTIESNIITNNAHDTSKMTEKSENLEKITENPQTTLSTLEKSDNTDTSMTDDPLSAPITPSQTIEKSQNLEKSLISPKSSENTTNTSQAMSNDIIEVSTDSLHPLSEDIDPIKAAQLFNDDEVCSLRIDETRVEYPVIMVRICYKLSRSNQGITITRPHFTQHSTIIEELISNRLPVLSSPNQLAGQQGGVSFGLPSHTVQKNTDNQYFASNIPAHQASGGPKLSQNDLSPESMLNYIKSSLYNFSPSPELIESCINSLHSTAAVLPSISTHSATTASAYYWMPCAPNPNARHNISLSLSLPAQFSAVSSLPCTQQRAQKSTLIDPDSARIFTSLSNPLSLYYQTYQRRVLHQFIPFTQQTASTFGFSVGLYSQQQISLLDSYQIQQMSSLNRGGQNETGLGDKNDYYKQYLQSVYNMHLGGTNSTQNTADITGNSLAGGGSGGEIGNGPVTFVYYTSPYTYIVWYQLYMRQLLTNCVFYYAFRNIITHFSNIREKQHQIITKRFQNDINLQQHHLTKLSTQLSTLTHWLLAHYYDIPSPQYLIRLSSHSISQSSALLTLSSTQTNQMTLPHAEAMDQALFSRHYTRFAFSDDTHFSFLPPHIRHQTLSTWSLYIQHSLGLLPIVLNCNLSMINRERSTPTENLSIVLSEHIATETCPNAGMLLVHPAIICGPQHIEQTMYLHGVLSAAISHAWLMTELLCNFHAENWVAQGLIGLFSHQYMLLVLGKNEAEYRNIVAQTLSFKQRDNVTHPILPRFRNGITMLKKFGGNKPVAGRSFFNSDPKVLLENVRLQQTVGNTSILRANSPYLYHGRPFDPGKEFGSGYKVIPDDSRNVVEDTYLDFGMDSHYSPFSMPGSDLLASLRDTNTFLENSKVVLDVHSGLSLPKLIEGMMRVMTFSLGLTKHYNLTNGESFHYQSFLSSIHQQPVHYQHLMKSFVRHYYHKYDTSNPKHKDIMRALTTLFSISLKPSVLDKVEQGKFYLQHLFLVCSPNCEDQLTVSLNNELVFHKLKGLQDKARKDTENSQKVENDDKVLVPGSIASTPSLNLLGNVPPPIPSSNNLRKPTTSNPPPIPVTSLVPTPSLLKTDSMNANTSLFQAPLQPVTTITPVTKILAEMESILPPAEILNNNPYKDHIDTQKRLMQYFQSVDTTKIIPKPLKTEALAKQPIPLVSALNYASALVPFPQSAFYNIEGVSQHGGHEAFYSRNFGQNLKAIAIFMLLCSFLGQKATQDIVQLIFSRHYYSSLNNTTNAVDLFNEADLLSQKLPLLSSTALRQYFLELAGDQNLMATMFTQHVESDIVPIILAVIKVRKKDHKINLNLFQLQSYIHPVIYYAPTPPSMPTSHGNLTTAALNANQVTTAFLAVCDNLVADLHKRIFDLLQRKLEYFKTSAIGPQDETSQTTRKFQKAFIDQLTQYLAVVPPKPKKNATATEKNPINALTSIIHTKYHLYAIYKPQTNDRGLPEPVKMVNDTITLARKADSEKNAQYHRWVFSLNVLEKPKDEVKLTQYPIRFNLQADEHILSTNLAASSGTAATKGTTSLYATSYASWNPTTTRLNTAEQQQLTLEDETETPHITIPPIMIEVGKPQIQTRADPSLPPGSIPTGTTSTGTVSNGGNPTAEPRGVPAASSMIIREQKNQALNVLSLYLDSQHVSLRPVISHQSVGLTLNLLDSKYMDLQLQAVAMLKRKDSDIFKEDLLLFPPNRHYSSASSSASAKKRPGPTSKDIDDEERGKKERIEELRKAACLHMDTLKATNTQLEIDLMRSTRLYFKLYCNTLNPYEHTRPYMLNLMFQSLWPQHYTGAPPHSCTIVSALSSLALREVVTQQFRIFFWRVRVSAVVALAHQIDPLPSDLQPVTSLFLKSLHPHYTNTGSIGAVQLLNELFNDVICAYRAQLKRQAMLRDDDIEENDDYYMFSGNLSENNSIITPQLNASSTQNDESVALSRNKYTQQFTFQQFLQQSQWGNVLSSAIFELLWENNLLPNKTATITSLSSAYSHVKSRYATPFNPSLANAKIRSEVSSNNSNSSVDSFTSSSSPLLTRSEEQLQEMYRTIANGDLSFSIANIPLDYPQLSFLPTNDASITKQLAYGSSTMNTGFQNPAANPNFGRNSEHSAEKLNLFTQDTIRMVSRFYQQQYHVQSISANPASLEATQIMARNIIFLKLWQHKILDFISLSGDIPDPTAPAFLLLRQALNNYTQIDIFDELVSRDPGYQKLKSENRHFNNSFFPVYAPTAPILRSSSQISFVKGHLLGDPYLHHFLADPLHDLQYQGLDLQVKRGDGEHLDQFHPEFHKYHTDVIKTLNNHGFYEESSPFFNGSNNYKLILPQIRETALGVAVPDMPYAVVRTKIGSTLCGDTNFTWLLHYLVQRTMKRQHVTLQLPFYVLLLVIERIEDDVRGSARIKQHRTSSHQVNNVLFDYIYEQGDLKHMNNPGFIPAPSPSVDAITEKEKYLLSLYQIRDNIRKTWKLCVLQYRQMQLHAIREARADLERQFPSLLTSLPNSHNQTSTTTTATVPGKRGLNFKKVGAPTPVTVAPPTSLPGVTVISHQALSEQSVDFFYPLKTGGDANKDDKSTLSPTEVQNRLLHRLNTLPVPFSHNYSTLGGLAHQQAKHLHNLSHPNHIIAQQSTVPPHINPAYGLIHDHALEQLDVELYGIINSPEMKELLVKQSNQSPDHSHIPFDIPYDGLITISRWEWGVKQGTGVTLQTLPAELTPENSDAPLYSASLEDESEDESFRSGKNAHCELYKAIGDEGQGNVSLRDIAAQKAKSEQNQGRTRRKRPVTKQQQHHTFTTMATHTDLQQLGFKTALPADAAEIAVLKTILTALSDYVIDENDLASKKHHDLSSEYYLKSLPQGDILERNGEKSGKSLNDENIPGFNPSSMETAGVTTYFSKKYTTLSKSVGFGYTPIEFIGVVIALLLQSSADLSTVHLSQANRISQNAILDYVHDTTTDRTVLGIPHLNMTQLEDNMQFHAQDVGVANPISTLEATRVAIYQSCSAWQARLVECLGKVHFAPTQLTLAKYCMMLVHIFLIKDFYQPSYQNMVGAACIQALNIQYAKGNQYTLKQLIEQRTTVHALGLSEPFVSRIRQQVALFNNISFPLYMTPTNSIKMKMISFQAMVLRWLEISYESYIFQAPPLIRNALHRAHAAIMCNPAIETAQPHDANLFNFIQNVYDGTYKQNCPVNKNNNNSNDENGQHPRFFDVSPTQKWTYVQQSGYSDDEVQSGKLTEENLTHLIEKRYGQHGIGEDWKGSGSIFGHLFYKTLENPYSHNLLISRIRSQCGVPIDPGSVLQDPMVGPLCENGEYPSPHEISLIDPSLQYIMAPTTSLEPWLYIKQLFTKNSSTLLQYDGQRLNKSNHKNTGRYDYNAPIWHQYAPHSSTNPNYSLQHTQYSQNSGINNSKFSVFSVALKTGQELTREGGNIHQIPPHAYGQWFGTPDVQLKLHARDNGLSLANGDDFDQNDANQCQINAKAAILGTNHNYTQDDQWQLVHADNMRFIAPNAYEYDIDLFIPQPLTPVGEVDPNEYDTFIIFNLSHLQQHFTTLPLYDAKHFKAKRGNISRQNDQTSSETLQLTYEDTTKTTEILPLIQTTPFTPLAKLPSPARYAFVELIRCILNEDNPQQKTVYLQTIANVFVTMATSRPVLLEPFKFGPHYYFSVVASNIKSNTQQLLGIYSGPQSKSTHSDNVILLGETQKGIRQAVELFISLLSLQFHAATVQVGIAIKESRKNAASPNETQPYGSMDDGANKKSAQLSQTFRKFEDDHAAKISHLVSAGHMCLVLSVNSKSDNIQIFDQDQLYYLWKTQKEFEKQLETLRIMRHELEAALDSKMAQDSRSSLLRHDDKAFAAWHISQEQYARAIAQPIPAKRRAPDNDADLVALIIAEQVKLDLLREKFQADYLARKKALPTDHRPTTAYSYFDYIDQSQIRQAYNSIKKLHAQHIYNPFSHKNVFNQHLYQLPVPLQSPLSHSGIGYVHFIIDVLSRLQKSLREEYDKLSRKYLQTEDGKEYDRRVTRSKDKTMEEFTSPSAPYPFELTKEEEKCFSSGIKYFLFSRPYRPFTALLFIDDDDQEETALTMYHNPVTKPADSAREMRSSLGSKKVTHLQLPRSRPCINVYRGKVDMDCVMHALTIKATTYVPHLVIEREIEDSRQKLMQAICARNELKEKQAKGLVDKDGNPIPQNNEKMDDQKLSEIMGDDDNTDDALPTLSQSLSQHSQQSQNSQMDSKTPNIDNDDENDGEGLEDIDGNDDDDDFGFGGSSQPGGVTPNDEKEREERDINLDDDDEEFDMEFDEEENDDISITSSPLGTMNDDLAELDENTTTTTATTSTSKPQQSKTAEEVSEMDLISALDDLLGLGGDGDSAGGFHMESVGELHAVPQFTTADDTAMTDDGPSYVPAAKAVKPPTPARGKPGAPRNPGPSRMRKHHTQREKQSNTIKEVPEGHQLLQIMVKGNFGRLEKKTIVTDDLEQVAYQASISHFSDYLQMEYMATYMRKRQMLKDKEMEDKALGAANAGISALELVPRARIGADGSAIPDNSQVNHTPNGANAAASKHRFDENQDGSNQLDVGDQDSKLLARFQDDVHSQLVALTDAVVTYVTNGRLNTNRDQVQQKANAKEKAAFENYKRRLVAQYAQQEAIMLAFTSPTMYMDLEYITPRHNIKLLWQSVMWHVIEDNQFMMNTAWGMINGFLPGAVMLENNMMNKLLDQYEVFQAKQILSTNNAFHEEQVEFISETQAQSTSSSINNNALYTTLEGDDGDDGFELDFGDDDMMGEEDINEAAGVDREQFKRYQDMFSSFGVKTNCSLFETAPQPYLTVPQVLPSTTQELTNQPTSVSMTTTTSNTSSTSTSMMDEHHITTTTTTTTVTTTTTTTTTAITPKQPITLYNILEKHAPIASTTSDCHVQERLHELQDAYLPLFSTTLNTIQVKTQRALDVDQYNRYLSAQQSMDCEDEEIDPKFAELEGHYRAAFLQRSRKPAISPLTSSMIPYGHHHPLQQCNQDGKLWFELNLFGQTKFDNLTKAALMSWYRAMYSLSHPSPMMLPLSLSVMRQVWWSADHKAGRSKRNNKTIIVAAVPVTQHNDPFINTQCQNQDDDVGTEIMLAGNNSLNQILSVPQSQLIPPTVERQVVQNIIFSPFTDDDYFVPKLQMNQQKTQLYACLMKKILTTNIPTNRMVSTQTIDSSINSQPIYHLKEIYHISPRILSLHGSIYATKMQAPTKSTSSIQSTQFSKPQPTPLNHAQYFHHFALPFVDYASVAGELSYIVHPEVLISTTAQTIINAAIEEQIFDSQMTRFVEQQRKEETKKLTPIVPKPEEEKPVIPPGPTTTRSGLKLVDTSWLRPIKLPISQPPVVQKQPTDVKDLKLDNYKQTRNSVNHFLKLLLPTCEILPYTAHTIGLPQRAIQREVKDKYIATSKALRHQPQKSQHHGGQKKSHNEEKQRTKKAEDDQKSAKTVDTAAESESIMDGMNQPKAELDSLKHAQISAMLNGRDNVNHTLHKFTMSSARSDVERLADEFEQ